MKKRRKRNKYTTWFDLYYLITDVIKTTHIGDVMKNVHSCDDIVRRHA